jgi:hypothetical protein
MRRLAILLIGTLATVSVLATVGCQSIQNAMYKSAIEKALQQDSLTGTDPTMEHAANMRKIDLSDCPPEFRVAYMKHIEAWEEAAKVRQAKTELDNQADAAAAAGVLATLFDSNATPWNDHLRAEQEVQRLDVLASADIHSTWETLEQIASKYGAQVPQS